MLELQSVDNLFVVVQRYMKAEFAGDEVYDLEVLYKMPQQINWLKG